MKAAIDEEKNRRRQPKKNLHKEIAEDLNRCREGWHLCLVAGSLEQLKKRVQRTLIEGRNHRLGDVRKEVVDAEARTRERIDPVGLQEAADDELKQELGQVARLNRVMMQTERHRRGLPVHD